MNNSLRGPDNLDKKLLAKYPRLAEVLDEKGRLGPIRVVRKPLEEVKKVLEALPDKYFNYKWYDCEGDALAFGYENHLILWIETNIENLPVFTQTVVYRIMEEKNMFNENQLVIYKDIAGKLAEILDAQVVDIDEKVIDKIADKAKEQFMEDSGLDNLREIPEVSKYLTIAKEAIVKSHFNWKEALDGINPQFGYNKATGSWDLETPTTEASEGLVKDGYPVCTLEDIGDMLPIALNVYGRGGVFGYLTDGYSIISKEELLSHKPVQMYPGEDDMISAVNVDCNFGGGDEVMLSPWEAQENGKLYSLISKADLDRLNDYFARKPVLHVFNGL